MSLLAFEDARRFFDRAEKLLANVAGEERRVFHAIFGLGLTHMRAAEVVLAKQMFERAMAIARRGGDGELFTRAVLESAYEYAPWVRETVLIARLEEALALLPPGDGALRARCLAQLAAERQPEADTAAPIVLARTAIDMARRVNDPTALRFTLSAASIAMLSYAEPEERHAVLIEALDLAASANDKRLAMRAHLFLAGVYWELGDFSGGEAHVEEIVRLVSELGHDRFGYYGDLVRSSKVLAEGRFQESENLFLAASTLFRRKDEAPGIGPAMRPVAFACAAERHDVLPALVDDLRARFRSTGYPLAVCVGELAVAQVYARIGDRERTREQLERAVAHPTFAEIKEASWLALLAEPVHLLGETSLAERIYPVLLPRARRWFTLGPLSTVFEPPYARQLGLLAEVLGRIDVSVAHLEQALAQTARAGMRAYVARLSYELAGVLIARGERERAAKLLEDAHTFSEELGQHGLKDPIAKRRASISSPNALSIAPPSAFTFAREGDHWIIRFGPHTARFRDSRGFQVLAQLVAEPNVELHVLQLVSGSGVDGGNAGVLLDARAMQSYRARLLDLRASLEDAEELGDATRSLRIEHEIDALTQELARAVGLGGRTRRAGDAAERARTAVQKRLREAIRRIGDTLPELGVHLEQTIRTGSFCGYLPHGSRRRRKDT